MNDDQPSARKEIPTALSIAVPPAAAGQRADRFLAEHLAAHPAGLSRSRLKQLIAAGAVTLEGAPLDEPALKVRAGQTFAIKLPDPEPAEPIGQAMDLTVVYEDGELIVVDKPAGLVVHPAPGNPDRTLVNALIAHCGASLSGIGGVRRPGIVHRLDKDTSGLLVAAKSDRAHQALSAAFQTRDIERHYLALVWGVPAPARGTITGNIGRDPRNRQRMAVVARGGKEAETHYRVVKVLAQGAASLVECRLMTGRTHQIRVHMASRGHPLLGDPLYGRTTARRLAALPEEARATVQAFRRQALHAASLGFRHPASKEWLQFQSLLPQDQEFLLETLERL